MFAKARQDDELPKKDNYNSIVLVHSESFDTLDLANASTCVTLFRDVRNSTSNGWIMCANLHGVLDLFAPATLRSS